ncbi:MAG: NUDIX domain-containing protein [Candidatus Aenigmarchaeota archaeon]|nr:NUDIX domain-containing protein [Candidatus Aenigmarchaeota archaeon]
MREHSCGVVILHHEGTAEPLYLLLHYESGHWDFVKGHQEAGETEEQTVRRETREETGITDLVFVDGFRHEISYRYQLKGQLMHKTVIFFLAETKTKHVTLSHEHIECIWLPFAEALKQTTFKNAKEVLTKAQDYWNSKR